MRKRMALGLFVVLVMLASVCLGEGSAPAGGSDEFGTIGATVLFGRYEQDNDFSNGSEKIEWIVLDVQDGKSLLLSKYLLDSKPYNDRIGEITWAECSLREWLNHEFMDSAFTGRDQERILPTRVENEAQEDSRASGGEDTLDQVFLLSYREAYLQYLSGQSARQCAPTDYAIAQGSRASDMCFSYGRGTGPWWLRTPGRDQESVTVVRYDGTSDGINGTEHAAMGHIAVRPAMWVITDWNTADGEKTEGSGDGQKGGLNESGTFLRNEKLDESFEADTIELAPAETASPADGDAGSRILEEIKASAGGDLQDGEFSLLSLSPAGNSGLLAVGNAGACFYDGEFHMLEPSVVRGVADQYQHLESYYRDLVEKAFGSMIGAEGVAYSPNGKYAAVYNQQLNAMRGFHFDPILVDLSTGELILTATYPSQMEDGGGTVTAAAFSGNGECFYYALRGRKGDTRLRFFRYDMTVGKTEECFRSQYEADLLHRMYQIAERSLIVATDEGLLNLCHDGGEWTISTQPYNLSGKYFSPEALYWSAQQGCAVLMGQNSAAFQVISPDNGFDGMNRYLCIRADSEKVVPLFAEEYRGAVEKSAADGSALPFRTIVNSALSPDGNYLLVNTRMLDSTVGEKRELLLIRLADLSVRKVKVSDEQLNLRMLAMAANVRQVIEWNTDELLIRESAFDDPRAFTLK